MNKVLAVCGLFCSLSGAAARLPLHFEACLGTRTGCYAAHTRSYDVRVSTEGLLLSRSAERRISVEFAGANKGFTVQPEDPLESHTNYLLGNDASKWRTNIVNYSRVICGGVYPGIDIVLYGREDQLEYDFVLSVGASPKRIRMSISTERGIELDSNGDAILHADFGDIRQHKPQAHQEEHGVRRSVDVHYRLFSPNQIGIEVGPYNPKLPLIVDPMLSFFDIVGDGYGQRVALDEAHNIYVAGFVASSLSPSTPGSFQMSYHNNGFCSRGEGPPGPCDDMYITKWDPSGTRLMWATYLGGSSDDWLAGMAVDAAGNVYLTGWTSSPDFPTTPGTIQPSYFGTRGPLGYTLVGDAFVTKLNSSGTGLVYSTFLGGTNSDAASAIAIDAEGNAYITGSTASTDFPITSGALQKQIRTPQAGINSTAFVAKLNPTATKLIYSTYLGGSGGDGGTTIAIDQSGIAYVAGNTTSMDFPTTPGAYQPSVHNSVFSVFGGGHGFLARIDPSGSSLLSATYFGGSAGDQLTSLVLDSANDIYLAGSTESTDLPTTPDALQRHIAESVCANANDIHLPCSDVFVAKFNSTASNLLYSTFLGGTGTDMPSDLQVSADGRIFVTGSTDSSDFPVTENAFQPCSRAAFQGQNAFLIEFKPGTPLGYSTYFGGTSGATTTGMAIDGDGGVYVTGTSIPGIVGFDFPPAPAPFVQLGATGLGGMFLAKFDFGTAPSPVRISCVLNGASLLGGAITYGEIVQIIGAGLGPETTVGAQLDSNGKVSTSLSGVQVFFNGAPASLLSVQSGRIAAVVPSYYSPENAKQAYIQVQYRDTPTDVYPVAITGANPAVFSQDRSGKGPAAVLNQDGSLNSPNHPAARGSIVSIFGTGLPPGGIITQNGLQEPAHVLVSIGGYSADVLFAGDAPGLTGVFQVNARVPQQAPSGTNDSVLVSVDNLPSGYPNLFFGASSPQTVTMAVQ